MHNSMSGKGVLLAVVLFFLMTGISAAEDGMRKEVSRWGNGKIREVQSYDTDGNLRENTYYREDGTLEQDAKYDAYGNKIEESNYGENGKLMANSDGWAAIRFVYSGGNMVQETYYGEDGRVQERKRYDDQGDLVQKQYVGDNIDPDEEFNPVPPILSGESIDYYDQYGMPEGDTTVVRD